MSSANSRTRPKKNASPRKKKDSPAADAPAAPAGTERFPLFFAGSLLLPLFVSGISGPGEKKKKAG